MTQNKNRGWKVDGPSHLKKAFIEDLKSFGLEPLGNVTDEMIIQKGNPINSCNDSKTYQAIVYDVLRMQEVFTLPEQYQEALKYITGTSKSCKSESSNKKFKNINWSVEGSYGLIKAFSEELDRQGFICISGGGLGRNWDEGYRYITDFAKGIYTLDNKAEEIHFKLPEQWNEAFEYAIETEGAQEEIQKGDWVWIESLEKYALIKYTKDWKTYGFGFDGKWTDHFNMDTVFALQQPITRASKSEVEDRLWKEWEKRCREVGIEDPMNAKLEHFPNDFQKEPINEYQANYNYMHNSDKMSNNNGLIFKKGCWAKPKPENYPPKIEVAGYESEYHEECVSWGCIDIHEDVFLELYKAMRDGEVEIEISVHSQIDGRTITSDQIKQAAEYFQ